MPVATFEVASEDITTFREYWVGGNLPIALEHHEGVDRVHWGVDIKTLDYSIYLPLFFDGLREKEHPYKLLAREGVSNMLEHGGSKILPVIPQLIVPIKNALGTRDPEIVCAVLAALQQLVGSGEPVEALRPLSPQILPILHSLAEEADDGAEATGDGPQPVMRRRLQETVGLLQRATPPRPLILTLLDDVLPTELPDLARRATAPVTPGRAGLVNLGATCYMNSVLQMMFSIPQFREEVIAAAQTPGGPILPALTQLRVLFAAMRDGGMAWHGTWPLVDTLAFNGTPVDPVVQQDAYEFLQQFEDHLEPALEASSAAGLFRRSFGVETAIELVGMAPCPHTRSRPDRGFALSLDVRGHSTLEASLAAMVAGEVMEGDNALECDECGARVPTRMRTVLRAAGPHLLLHLKRFEFSPMTLLNEKIHDSLAFPLTIDLAPYTGNNADGDDWLYSLAGVVVQYGSLQFGHYYSIVRSDSGAWIMVNDETVTPFDIAALSTEAFGGAEGDPSAYLLLYSRPDGPTPTPAPAPPDIIPELDDFLAPARAIAAVTSPAGAQAVSAAIEAGVPTPHGPAILFLTICGLMPLPEHVIRHLVSTLSVSEARAMIYGIFHRPTEPSEIMDPGPSMVPWTRVIDVNGPHPAVGVLLVAILGPSFEEELLGMQMFLADALNADDTRALDPVMIQAIDAVGILSPAVFHALMACRVLHDDIFSMLVSALRTASVIERSVVAVHGTDLPALVQAAPVDLQPDLLAGLAAITPAVLPPVSVDLGVESVFANGRFGLLYTADVSATPEYRAAVNTIPNPLQVAVWAPPASAVPLLLTLEGYGVEQADELDWGAVARAPLATQRAFATWAVLSGVRLSRIGISDVFAAGPNFFAIVYVLMTNLPSARDLAGVYLSSWIDQLHRMPETAPTGLSPCLATLHAALLLADEMLGTGWISEAAPPAMVIPTRPARVVLTSHLPLAVRVLSRIAPRAVAKSLPVLVDHVSSDVPQLADAVISTCHLLPPVNPTPDVMQQYAIGHLRRFAVDPTVAPLHWALTRAFPAYHAAPLPLSRVISALPHVPAAPTPDPDLARRACTAVLSAPGPIIMLAIAVDRTPDLWLDHRDFIVFILHSLRASGNLGRAVRGPLVALLSVAAKHEPDLAALIVRGMVSTGPAPGLMARVLDAIPTGPMVPGIVVGLAEAAPPLPRLALTRLDVPLAPAQADRVAAGLARPEVVAGLLDAAWTKQESIGVTRLSATHQGLADALVSAVCDDPSDRGLSMIRMARLQFACSKGVRARLDDLTSGP